jgi:uncharacterized protein involved in exopolysaccharide biosynthesis
MHGLTPAILEAAGKNNYTLIVFLVYSIMSAVSIWKRKEKTGVRLTLMLSVVVLVAIAIYRVTAPPAHEGNTTVRVDGKGNATSTGPGSSADVHNSNPPEK